MPSLGTAYVTVKAELSKLKPGLDQARKTVGSSVDKMVTQIGRISFAAAKIGVVAFSAAVVYNMKKSIDAASDLEEVVAKFGTVYKDQIKIAEKNAKVLVDSYGLSERAAKQYLGSMQDLLVPMGMASSEAVKLSNEIVKLSVDLGSFNNMQTADVMRDIQSALVGNFETMKKYGVVLNVATVTQEALNSGLIKSKDQLDANIKAQAAYQLIVKGSQFAIGDWQRTQDGFANTMKQFHSTLEDVRAEIGKNLLPIITPIVRGFNDWLKANGQLLAQDMKGWIGGITEAIKIGIKPLQVWSDLWKALGWHAGGGKGLMPGAPGGPPLTPPKPPEYQYPDPGSERPGMSGGVSTGGGVGGDMSEVQKQALEDSLAAIIENKEMLKEAELSYRQWEMDTLTSSEEYKQTVAQDFHNQALDLLKIRSQEKRDIELSHIEEVAEAERKAGAMRLKFDQSIAKSKFAIAQGLGTGLLAAAGASGKAIFAVMKAIEIGKAIMGTHAAAAMALATPPAPNIAAEALALKAGYLNVAAIAATALGQMAVSSAGGGGGTYTSPTITSPTTGVTEYETTPEEKERGTLTINIQGDFIGDEGYIDMLVEKINDAEDRDVYINKSVYASETT